jgi:D-ribose pyranase
MHRTSTLLNGRLAHVVTTLRFGESIVVADAGLPVPPGVETLDLAIAPGLPKMIDVVAVLKDNLVIEEVRIAEEMRKANDEQRTLIHQLFSAEGCVNEVPHETIESGLREAKLVVQTGETTPYANVVLVGGVGFFELGMGD